MPYGGTTPSQDKRIERCVQRLIAGGKDKVSAIKICKVSILRGDEEMGRSTKKNKFNEALAFSVIENSVNEEKRTVRVCALASCISANNKYYSPSIVESQHGSLKNKKSYADHDERNTKNMVGKIVDEHYDSGKLFADIKFSKAKGIAEETFEKVKDGTIDSVSIAANGSGRMVEMDGKEVVEVTELNIRSVDFVPEGGVAEARVIKVFENISEIPEVHERTVNEKVIETVEQLQKEYPELVAKVAEEAAKEPKEQVETLTRELNDLKMAKVKEDAIAKLEVKDEVKDILRKRVSGDTEEAIATSVTSELEFLKSVSEAFKEEATIEGKHETEEEEKVEKDDNWSSERVRSDGRIPEGLKGEAIHRLWNSGKDAMIEYLAACDIVLEDK